MRTFLPAMLLLGAAAVSCPAQEADPAAPLLQWMDRIAQNYLDRRDADLRTIHTRQDAEARQARLREKLLRAIGGLPDYSGPLNARVTGTLNRAGYRIEKVVFESLPKYWVTGIVYAPASAGRHPAVLMPMGHWEEGKAAGQRISANLARKGFVVLAYDPIGQGERQCAYDARLGRSLVGGSTEQHILAGAQSILASQTFARYRVWDARRALDYLLSRPDVDASRAGCTGCSGGGTLTTYISALDPRIKVAAPACYMNTFRLLFRGPTGDSEQTLPDFLSSGLDLGDYVAAFAPKPWLISSTVGDFFPLEGARRIYEESRRWYKLFGAEDRVRWSIGPGGHGTPLQVREGIYEWMIRWLMDGKGSAAEEDVVIEPPGELLATASGQVSTELASRELNGIIAEVPRTLLAPAALVDYVRQWMPADSGGPPRFEVVNETRDAARVTRQIRFEVAPALPVQGTLIEPRAGGGTRPAVVVVETRNTVSPAAAALAQAGAVVLVLVPRGLPAASSRAFSGDWITNTRAAAIGLNLPCLRAGDIRRGVDILASLDGVDGRRIAVAAQDVAGVWALLAAATDMRIARVWLDRTPASFELAMRNPVHRGLHDAVIPGFWLHGDLLDLVRAIAPRQVLWTDPVDWNRNLLHPAGPYRYRPFESGDEPFIRELVATP